MRLERTAAVDTAHTRVVCHLIESLEYGGAEALVCRLAAGMRDGAYAPIVCCLRKGPLVERLESQGVRVHCLDLRRRSVFEGPAFVLFVLRLLRRLNHVLESEGVALIHAHLPDSIIPAACLGTLTRTPVIGTYHGLGILPEGRGRFDPRNILRRSLYRLLARLSDRTIAVSPSVRDLLCGDVGVDRRKVVLMLNGVDTEWSAPCDARGRVRDELGIADRRVITCVGRLTRAKGQLVLVEALASVIRQHPDATLLLVGEGPDRAAIESRIRVLGLADHVRLTGARNDVPTLLAASEVFVLPSFSEGIPLSLVEAMAAGKPVVASAVPGNRDVVVDDRYGVLVPPGDAPALADALRGLLANPRRARELGARGRGRVREHFDIKQLFAATSALYDQVLRERREPRPWSGRE